MAQRLHLGGPLNTQIIDVEDISLTRIADGYDTIQPADKQYILHDVDGLEVYALVGLCHRDVRARLQRYQARYPDAYASLTTPPADPPYIPDNDTTTDPDLDELD